MNRQRLLIIAVVVLLLLNAVTLTLLVLRPGSHGPGRPPEGPKAIIIERLHLDPAQVERYEELIQAHRRSIRVLDARMMRLREQLYAQSGGQADSLFVAIGAVQSEVERVHTAHFAEIRALCTPEQLPLYDALKADLASYFRHGPPPPRPER